MENNELLYGLAAGTGLLLQWLLRISSRKTGKKEKLLWNLGKCAVLLVIQVLLMKTFIHYSGSAAVLGSCIAASCVTFLIAAAVLVMQFVYERKYPMTDEQMMRLNDL